MAGELHSAENFVTSFDDEVGLVPRDLRSVAILTRNWPQFQDYMEGDNEILYEAEMPVQGKAYDYIGWFALLQPSVEEVPQRDRHYDIMVSVQFRRNEQWHNWGDYHYLVWEVEMGRDPAKLAFFTPDPGHLRMVQESLRDFVYNKLQTVTRRKGMRVHLMHGTPPISESTLAERLVEALLDPATFYQSFEAARFDPAPIEAVFDLLNSERYARGDCDHCDCTGVDPRYANANDFEYHPCPRCDGEGEFDRNVELYRKAVKLWNKAGPMLDRLKQLGVLRKHAAIDELFSYMNSELDGNYADIVSLSNRAGREIERAAKLLQRMHQ